MPSAGCTVRGFFVHNRPKSISHFLLKSFLFLIVYNNLIFPNIVQPQSELINSNVIIVGHLNSCVATGTTNTYACDLDRAITLYNPRTCYNFTANAANTAAATINFNSLGARTIKKVEGGITTDLVANDIRTGHIVHVCYDGTNMQCQNCLGNAASGTLAASGTPTAGQAAEWVTASTLQGVATTGTGSYVKDTSPTLLTPTIASLTNAQHTHTNAAGGGQLTDAALSAAVTVPKGGTGATALTGLVLGNGASPLTTVAAPTGAVVGTTDTQTLTGKTMDLASNTVTMTLAQLNTAVSNADLPPATRALNTTAPLGGGGDLTADRTLTCPTCTTNAAALTASLPVIGAGGQATAVGTRSGTTTEFGTTTGTKTQNQQLAFDASGNIIASGTAIGAGGGVTTATAQRAAFYNSTTTVDGAAGLTFAADGTTITTAADRITTLSSSATLGVNDGPVIACDATAGNVTATLPDGTTTTQRRFTLVKMNSNANTCTIAPNATGTDTINGIAGTAVLTAQWDRYDVTLLSAAAAANWSGTTAILASKMLTQIKSATIDAPTTADTSKLQWYFPAPITITRVVCSVGAATSVTIQLDERGEATPNTAGTAVLTTALVCDESSEATTTFTNATIAARVPLNLQLTAVSGTPTVLRVHVEYLID